MRLIDADELTRRIEKSYLTKGEKRLFLIKVRHMATVTPCENCDLYFKAMTKEEMKKGGAV